MNPSRMRYNEKLLLFVICVLSIVYRIFWIKLRSNFIVADEGIAGYLVKEILEKKDFPLVTTYFRHLSVYGEAYFAWIIYLLLKDMFLSLKITCIIQSFLVSLFLYLFLRSKGNHISNFIVFFPNIIMLDWTLTARAYGPAFLVISILLYTTLKGNWFIMGLFFGLGLWLFGIPALFLPVILLVRVKSVLDIPMFILGILLGVFPLTLYNLCNLSAYRNFFPMYYALPTIDDIILRMKGYLEGWIQFQCGLPKDFFPATVYKGKKMYFLLTSMNLIPPINSNLTPFWVLSIVITFLSIIFAFVKKTKISFILSLPAIIILLTSPHDRFFSFISIPHHVILSLGLSQIVCYLKSSKRNAVLFVLTITVIIYSVLSAFSNNKDCRGKYIHFQEEEYRDIHLKNFSCSGKNDNEFHMIKYILLKKGVRHIFSDFALAHIINAYFYPELIASTAGSTAIDMMPYATQKVINSLSEEGDVAFIYSSMSKALYPITIIKKILGQDITNRKISLRNYGIDIYILTKSEAKEFLEKTKSPLYNCFTQKLPFRRGFFECLKKISKS